MTFKCRKFTESKSYNEISNRFCNEINAKNVNKSMQKSLKIIYTYV